MARSYRPVVRDQEFLLPPNMADWLPEDHLVWFILEVVEQLDTTAFHRRRRRGGVGRQGYDPDMLLGLLLYAYAVGERSSRRIERLCHDHVAFRVLCGQDAPDHTTLARFRADHEADFASLFTQVLRLCAQAGMVRVGVVAIDGTKIAADAARGANRSAERVREQAEELARQILAEASEVDAAEDARTVPDEDNDGDGGLPADLSDPAHRAAAIKRALAELDRQDAQRAELDQPDQDRIRRYLQQLASGEPVNGRTLAGMDPVEVAQARIQRYQNKLARLEGLRGTEISKQRTEARRCLRRAEQALAEASARRAAGEEPDLRGHRLRQLDWRHDRRRAAGGEGRVVNLTDPHSRLMSTANGGKVHGYNAQVAVTDDHLILGVHLSQDGNDTRCFRPTLHAAQQAADLLGITIETVLADAGYFTTENLTCPGPDRLIAPGKHRDLLPAANEPIEDPPLDAPPLGLMRHRLRDEKAQTLYKRRSATVEPVIAHIKELIGLTRFSRRGLPAATAELQLTATVHNLRRMHTAALSNA
jgi:transposase